MIKSPSSVSRDSTANYFAAWRLKSNPDDLRCLRRPTSSDQKTSKSCYIICHNMRIQSRNSLKNCSLMYSAASQNCIAHTRQNATTVTDPAGERTSLLSTSPQSGRLRSAVAELQCREHPLVLTRPESRNVVH